jgi:DNA-binding GntR family transcriptional regulator
MVRVVTRTADTPARVADQIREQIARGALAPGLQLRQLELAELHKASRVPVREALKLLTAEGVVQHDPNRGFFVSALSSAEAQQLLRIRHLLEQELLSTIEWPSKQQLALLQSQVAELEELLQAGKATEWVKKHRAFYSAIFDLSPQKVISREVMRLLSLMDRYRALAPHVLPGTERKVTQERHLVASLAKRDRDRLLRVFDEDRTRIEEGLLGVLQARGL